MLIEDFLKYIRYELNLSTCTVLSYSNDLNQLVSFLVGGDAETFDPSSVTQSDVREWMARLSAQGDSGRTVRRKIQAVRAFYKYLMRRGAVAENPAKDVELAKLRPLLPKFVRDENINEFLDRDVDESDFTAVRNHLIVLMLYFTGMRRAELIGLQDAWVDVEAQELKALGKRNKERIVPFGGELAEWIVRYRQLRAATTGIGDTGTFFVRQNGEPLYPMLVERVVKRALEEAGGSAKQSPHVLRHTFASAMLNGGANINSVKELLGHESLAATQVYTHITFRELKSNYQLAHPRALKKGG